MVMTSDLLESSPAATTKIPSSVRRPLPGVWLCCTCRSGDGYCLERALSRYEDTLLSRVYCSRIIEGAFAPYKQELANQPLTFVGVHCEPRELSRRNSVRAIRAAGLVALQQKIVQLCGASSDLEASSSRTEPSEMAQEVISYIAHNPSSDGFRQSY